MVAVAVDVVVYREILVLMEWMENWDSKASMESLET